MERSMSKPFDLSKSLAALDQDSTLIVVIEMSQSSWLVAARAPGLARDPLKKLAPEPEQLFKLIDRWREESRKAGRVVRRVCVAFEAGRDGFWLARLLRQHDIEAYVIHPTSIPVKRDHRRAKTDRLDTELLMRAFLGWLRGEADHCSMAAIPTLAEEDAKRPTRERESRVNARSRLVNRMKGALARLGIRGFNPKLRKAAEKLEELRTGAGEPLPPNTLAELRRDMGQLRFVADQIKQIEKAREARLEKAPREGAHLMVLMLASIKGRRPRDGGDAGGGSAFAQAARPAQFLEIFGRLAQFRIEAANAQPRQRALHPIDEAAAGVDPALALAGGAFGVFLRQRRDRRHAAMVGLAAQPAQERAHQELRVEPIRLGATMIPLYRDARGMNDIGLDVVLAEQPREPEPVAPRLEGDADPL